MIYLDKERLSLIEAAIKNSLPTLLVGETGIGKTTIITELANEKKIPLTRLSLNDQVGREDLIGKFGLEKGNTKWMDGPVLDAMKKGYWVVLDEINSARPEVLFALHSITDHEKSIVIQECGNEKVVAHKNFRLFACMNPISYHGTKNLNQAFMSRFVVVDIPVQSRENEYTIITSQTNVQPNEATKLIEIADMLRFHHNKQEIQYFCSTRDLIYAATLIADKVSIQTAVYTSILNKMKDDDFVFVQDFIKGSTKFKDLLKQTTKVDSIEDSIAKKKELEEGITILERRKGQLDNDFKTLQSQFNAVNAAVQIAEKNKRALESECDKLQQLTESQKKTIAKEYLAKVI